MLPRESDLMSDSILYRAIVGAELRADTAGRTIHGVVVPYNERARDQRRDRLVLGNVHPRQLHLLLPSPSAGHKVKLLAQHDQRRFPIGS